MPIDIFDKTIGNSSPLWQLHFSQYVRLRVQDEFLDRFYAAWYERFRPIQTEIDMVLDKHEAEGNDLGCLHKAQHFTIHSWHHANSTWAYINGVCTTLNKVEQAEFLDVCFHTFFPTGTASVFAYLKHLDKTAQYKTRNEILRRLVQYYQIKNIWTTHFPQQELPRRTP